MKNSMFWAITWILIIIALIAMTFGIVALAFYGICWAFGFTFSLRHAFSIWLTLYLLSTVFKRGGKE